VTEKFEKRKN